MSNASAARSSAPRILVAGANGRLGRRVVAEALSRGAIVTAFVRSSGSLPADDRLQVVRGRITEDKAALSQAMAGQHAVISALGNPLWLKGLHGPAIVDTAIGNLTDAMRANGVARIVVPLAWGTGQSRRPAGLLVRLVAATLIRRDFRDFTAAEERLVGSGLDWTIAYFGALSEGATTRRWSTDSELRTPRPLTIARSDLAQALVDAAVHKKFVRERIVLSGGGSR